MNKKLLYTVLMLISVAALVGGALIGVNMMDSFDGIKGTEGGLDADQSPENKLNVDYSAVISFALIELVLSVGGFALATVCHKNAPEERIELSAKYLRIAHVALLVGAAAVVMAVFLM